MPALIEVPFHDVILFVTDDDPPLVPMRPVVEALGLSWGGQYEKLAGDARWGVRIIRTPSAGGAQNMATIPITKLMAWVMTLQAGRVKPELRERLARLQEEGDRVLFDHWFRARHGQMVAHAHPQHVAEARARAAALERAILAEDPAWHGYMREIEALEDVIEEANRRKAGIFAAAKQAGIDINAMKAARRARLSAATGRMVEVPMLLEGRRHG